MNKALTLFRKYSALLPEVASRIVVGYVFIESGWGKLHALDKVIAYFDSLGIPFANLQAPFVASVELLTGLFIAMGLFTRLSSLPLIVIMMVAIRTAKWEDITDFSSLLGVSEFLYIVILTWLITQGSKYLSIDALICRFKSRIRKGDACH